MTDEKRCSRCKRILPLSSFNKQTRNKHIDGLSGRCQDCDKDYKMRDLYGISVEDYAALYLAQNGRCAICKHPEYGRKLPVDHDHKTNKIRGLLCTRCNAAISQLRDDPEIVLAAYRYLTKEKA